MEMSADSPREQRKRETARGLTDAARRLTRERGFGGYTVDELCTEVGISRRTFFNYFESKENAVYGFTGADSRMAALDDKFAAADGDVVDDFVDLLIARWELGDAASDAPEMFRAIEDEPKLLRGLFERITADELRDIELVMRRQDDGDRLRAEVLVHGVGALMRLSVDQILKHSSTESYADLLRHRLDAARSVFSIHSTRTERTAD